jgi:hypothetical protein
MIIVTSLLTGEKHSPWSSYAAADKRETAGVLALQRERKYCKIKYYIARCAQGKEDVYGYSGELTE